MLKIKGPVIGHITDNHIRKKKLHRNCILLQLRQSLTIDIELEKKDEKNNKISQRLIINIQTFNATLNDTIGTVEHLHCC